MKKPTGNKVGRPKEGSLFLCITCNKDFYRSKSEILRERTKYCSIKCIPRLAEKNPSWKGGKFLDPSNGYVYIRDYVNKKYVFEHRKIMEEYLGKKLTRRENIHHINGEKTDNRIENFEIIDVADHARLHNLLRPKKFCECGLQHYCKGLCKYHYEKERRMGN